MKLSSKDKNNVPGQRAAAFHRCLIMLLFMDAHRDIAFNSREWAERFGVSRRTISRDVAFLCSIGFEIDFDMQKNGFVLRWSLKRLITDVALRDKLTAETAKPRG